MAEFLSNAPSNQLFILMLCPLVAAILLFGFIFFSFSRRRRKSAMKLGIQPKKEADTADAADLVDQQTPAANPVDNDMPLEQASTWPGAEQAPAEEDLNLNILGGGIESDMAATPPSIDDEPVDLSARLGSPPDQPSPAEPPSVVAVSTPPTETTTVPVSPSEEDAAELLRLLRHPQTGQLIVEVVGQQYNKLTDITDREVGQYILELAANFLAFTNGVVATEAGVKSVYLPKVKQTPEPLIKFTPVSSLPDPDDSASAESEEQETPESEPLVPPPPPEAEAAFLASLHDIQSTPQPSAPATQSRGFLGLSRSKEPAPELPLFNLAGEINKIVQARLMASPLAATTNIEILSDPSGGIRIKVNGQIYAGPDDIPDPEVKRLIKDSIKQWERS
jgi:hypothetical protein